MNKDDLIKSINEISIDPEDVSKCKEFLISEYKEFLINVLRKRDSGGNLIYISRKEAEKMFLEHKGII